MTSVREILAFRVTVELYRASKKPPVNGICSGILSPLRGRCIAIVVDPWLAHMGYCLVAAPRLRGGNRLKLLQITRVDSTAASYPQQDQESANRQRLR